MGSQFGVKDFSVGIQRIRQSVQGLAAIPNVKETGWDPEHDLDFWNLLDQIEQAGLDRRADKAPWLVEFTQIDDLGPMGRTLFLAKGALLALRLMPQAALEAAELAHRRLGDDASPYRKVGICKAVATSGIPTAESLIEPYLKDPHTYVREQAELALCELKEALRMD